MHRPNLLTSLLPLTLVLTAISGLFVLLTIVFFPETVMRNALDVKVADLQSPAYGPLNKVFKDEILDEPSALLDANVTFQPVALAGSFVVGDRLSVRHGKHDLRSFIVVDVHRIEALSEKIYDKSESRTWVLVIAEDVAHPDGPKYRFIVEESDPVAFRLEKTRSQAL